MIRHLFEMFGNPLAVQRAVEAATPNPAQVEEHRHARARAAEGLGQVEEARGRLVGMVARGTFREKDVEGEMAKLRERECRLLEESARLGAVLANVSDPAAVRGFARTASRAFALRMAARYENMAWDEKRGVGGVGVRWADTRRRMGIYVTRGEKPGVWKYTLRGHLTESKGFTPATDERAECFGLGQLVGKAELGSVTDSASNSRRRRR